MTVAQMPILADKVLGILEKASKPLSVPEIEQELVGQTEIEADTFDVREAVWRLVREQRAEFTPRRRVTLPKR